MSLRVLLFVSLCVVVRSELVYHRNCVKGTGDSPKCHVSSVEFDACSHAPRFCRLTHGKRYPVTVTFVPYFAAEDVGMNTMVDLNKDGSYVQMMKTKRVCQEHQLVCPLEPYVRQQLKFDLEITDNLNGSHPVLVNFYNAKNETDNCCFIFKAKTTGQDLP